jgi:Sulfotransferase domain
VSKIFCIGLNKTGTISLHEALTVLGYRSLHWGGPEAFRAVTRAKGEGKPLLTYLGDFDAFSDIGSLTANFDVADRDYPDSKFILTVRRLEDWLDSRRRHVEKNQWRHAAGQYDGTFLEVDFEAWTAEYHEHHSRVERHFIDRPNDLLRLDITAGDGWEPLCRFLGRPVPDIAFPWKNRYRPLPAPSTTQP